MRINSNIPSLGAQRSLSFISRALSRSLERLASGKRINSARDDASGLAVSIGLKAQANGLARTVQNMNEAFGYLNAADGALQTQVDLVQRMRELAVQAANGTLSSDDRSQIQLELDQLMEEFNRIGSDSEFNGSKLLDGSLSTLSLQVGTSKDQTIDFGIESSLEADVFTEDVLESTLQFSYQPNTTRTGESLHSTADLDGDGLRELVTFDYSVISIFENDGEGGFSLTATYAQTGDNLFVQDLNNDGKDDLLVSNFDQRISFISRGNADFESPLTHNLIAGQVLNNGFGDFNGDGNIDILNSNGSNLITVNYGLGTGAFGASVTVSSGTSFNSIYIRDLNNDGIDDVFFGSVASQSRYVRMGSASGNFSVGTTQTSLATAIYGTYNVEDMNGDGILDFVDKDTAGNLEIRFGTSSGGYTLLAETAMGANWDSLYVNDIDGDGDNDVVAGYQTGGTAAVRLNNGVGSVSTGTTVDFGSANAYIEQLEDFNGDGRADLVARTGTQLLQRLASSSGTFSSTATINWTNLVGAYYEDLNNDGYLDAVGIYGFGTISVSVAFSGANGFGVATNYGTNSSSGGTIWHADLSDLNDDGFADIMMFDEDMLSGETYTLIQQTRESEEAASVNLETQESAQDSLEILDNALQNLNERRSNIGALQNRLESAVNANSLTRENLLGAYSQIIDADLAQETAELVKNQIAQQAATAVLATANTSLQLALRLLN